MYRTLQLLKPFGIAGFTASPLQRNFHIADYYGNSSFADLQQSRQSFNPGCNIVTVQLAEPTFTCAELS